MADNKRPKRGEVWWGNPKLKEPGIQAGMRPWIVMSNDLYNRHSMNVTAVPCTTKMKKGLQPTHVMLFMNGKTQMAMCEQITTFSQEDMTFRIGTLLEQEMEEIERAVMVQLGLEEAEG